MGLLLLLLVMAASGALWWQQVRSEERLRSETTAQTELRAAQVTSAVSAAASILFRAIESASQVLADSYATDRGTGFTGRVASEIEQLPPGVVLQVAVIDATGHLAYSNLGMSERVFLGDREHFQVHLDPSRRALFVSKPVLGRVSKQWSIQFSRPIYRDDRFMGVLVMSVAPAYLQRVLADVALQSDDSISILRQSGEFLARNRDMERTLGKVSDSSRPFIGANAPVTGSYVATSEIDQVERIFSWQRLPDFPVTVVLGLSTQSSFQPINRVIEENRVKAVAGIALLALMAVVGAWMGRFIHKQARRSDALELAAMYDTLTGLSSRHALMEHLHRTLARAEKDGTRVGLLYVDLDRFKAVNDHYGHAAGDAVLVAVARAIQACLRKTDMAARIGGDEFVMVITPLDDHDILDDLQARIAQALSTPLSVAGVQLDIGASAGAAVFPDHGRTVDALLSHADHAMYVQKGDRRAAGTDGRWLRQLALAK